MHFIDLVVQAGDIDPAQYLVGQRQLAVVRCKAATFAGLHIRVGLVHDPGIRSAGPYMGEQ
ncbi:hypothetical protein D3C77_260130 [compost metagenome]